MLLPAAGVEPSPGNPSELLTTGETAYNSGEWQKAADAFQKFLTDFGGLEDTKNVVAKVKPLLAICHVRLNQFEPALPLLHDALKTPGLDPKQLTDLLFFSGLANFRSGNTAEARKHLGAIFTDASVERSRRMEALILGGTSYAVDRNWKETIGFFRKYGAEISAHSAEAGSRANLLLLHALMQENQWDEALKLAANLRAHISEVRQTATFASLMIGIGSHFLEAGEFHQAIRILAIIPTKAEIETAQRQRLAETENDLKHAEDSKNSVRSAQLRAVVDELKRELDAFAKIPQFDSAARLRLAGAYFQLNRVREGCLILDQMVRQMEPDATVEAATTSLIRGWMSLSRFKRASRTADLYMERCAALPEKPNLPDVMFLKAQALEGMFQYHQAADAYLETAKRFPEHPIEERARFMAAYNILQLEDHAKAGAMFDTRLEKIATTDEMWQHVIFWRAMAYYFNQQWEECRGHLSKYSDDAKTEKAGQEYLDDAAFRIGYSYFAEARYPEAIEVLCNFPGDFPASEWLPEALLTLGDCYAAQGDLAKAGATYAVIAPDAPGFHDEGWMKRGNLKKAVKDYAGMRKIYSEFLDQRPESPRIAEALQSLGWIAKQNGDAKQAREIYWNAIQRFGNGPPRPGLDDIFLGLAALYPSPERGELQTKLGDALEAAKAAKQRRLATRLGWTIAQNHRTAKTDDLTPEKRAAISRAALREISAELDAKETSPRILADVADALADEGDDEKAATVYEGLRKWWPRAPERDRAFAGLGFIARKNGETAKAMDFFDRFERTSVMPRSAPDERGVSLVEGELGGKVALARAALLAKREPGKAIDLLLALQKSKAMPAKIRASALLETARLHRANGRFREALPYYERVYLLFNRYPEMVAAAYFERGSALEELGMKDKAREVYSELANSGNLQGLAITAKGRRQAVELGGVIEPKDPEGALIQP